MTSLPPEIWDACIDSLHPDTSSLALASCVCKAWCRRARLHIFRNVHLYVIHSLERTRSFLRLLRSSTPTCTFLHAIHAFWLHEFDDPFHFLRHRKRFLQSTLQDLSTLTNLRELNIRHEFWGSSIGTTPISTLCRSLMRFTLHHATLPSIQDLAQTLALLPLLEELNLNAEFSRELSPDEMSQLLPLPATVRRFTFKARSPQQDQSQVFDWLASSAPSDLQYLWVNPASSDLPALRRALLRCRETLRSLYVRPEFKSDDKALTVVTQEDVVGYGEVALRDFPHVHLTSVTSFTLSLPFPLWMYHGSENLPLRAIMNFIDRIVGPSSESALEELVLRVHSPVGMAGIEFVDGLMGGRTPDGSYHAYPCLRTFSFLVSKITPAPLAELRRVYETKWTRIAERGVLHFRPVDAKEDAEDL